MSITNCVIGGNYRAVARMFGSPEMRAVFTKAKHLEKRGRIGRAKLVLREATLQALSRRPPSQVLRFSPGIAEEDVPRALAAAYGRNPQTADTYSLIMELKLRNMHHEVAALTAHCHHSPIRWFWALGETAAVNASGDVHPKLMASIQSELRPMLAALVKYVAFPVAGGRPIQLKYLEFDRSVHVVFSVDTKDLFAKVADKGFAPADPANPSEAEVKTAIKTIMGFNPTAKSTTHPLLRIGLRTVSALGLAKLFPYADRGHFQDLFVFGICIGYRIPLQLSQYGRLPGGPKDQVSVFSYSMIDYFKGLARSFGEQKIYIGVV
jgi:hypothetical protein